jgi:hypothetical protein
LLLLRQPSNGFRCVLRKFHVFLSKREITRPTTGARKGEGFWLNSSYRYRMSAAARKIPTLLPIMVDRSSQHETIGMRIIRQKMRELFA